ncbi:hypothetical protein [Mycobacterium sp. IDR2000157661]|uniref:hypothetical protein n=1 Tax=Mycobacterium sp. IDR2000157661 TaxID=2867005 RepID=UPI001EEBA08B|nr:hypothetical protein [Mycobacterium sp. IDR2000157661]ULE33606.1 hypothetical protein K3G64_02540 [Mycobacterium sp. IDR2000157661]
MAVVAGAGSALLAAGGIVAAVTMSAGAQLPFSPEAAATVTATPGFGSNRDSGFDLRRPQFTAQAPATPGQVECIPNLSRTACPPVRDRADSAAAGWMNEAQGPYTAIQSSLQTAASEMQAQNMDGVRSACKQILSNSQRLRNTLPSPDEALTAEVEGAVSELITAANMCLGPDATSNAQALMSHVEQANAHFANAQQIMESKSP